MTARIRPINLDRFAECLPGLAKLLSDAVESGGSLGFWAPLGHAEALLYWREVMQGMVDETFGRFKEVVREGRGYAATQNGTDGRQLVEGWEEFADGRIISGREARRLGFVDELGNFETAVERTLEITGLEAANLVTYRQPFRLGMLFRLLGESEGRASAKSQTVKLDLGVDLPRLEVGRLYFLPPYFAP